jgi:hypothetical protein
MGVLSMAYAEISAIGMMPSRSRLIVKVNSAVTPSGSGPESHLHTSGMHINFQLVFAQRTTASFM